MSTKTRLPRLMDLLHAVMACASSWGYLISHFGNAQIRDWIAWYKLDNVYFCRVETYSFWDRQVTVTIMLTVSTQFHPIAW